ncbi:MAG: hypothetical protein P1V97_18480, partial [Planctomycetota bacterium]|nr:hypothetical protein [Planctomycetota bacterium]
PPPKKRAPGDKSTGRMKRPSKEEMQGARAEGLKRKGPPPGPPPGPPRKVTSSQAIKKNDLNKAQAKKANEETAEFAPPPRDEMEKARQEGIARKAANMKELAKKQGAAGPAPKKVDETDDYDDFMMFADSADEAGTG